MASSVRLTTAWRLAVTLRNVLVSRKGFSTRISSPHSTPMGAKLIAPPVSLVVTMVSRITEPDPPAVVRRVTCSPRYSPGATRHRHRLAVLGVRLAHHGGSGQG